MNLGEERQSDQSVAACLSQNRRRLQQLQLSSEIDLSLDPHPARSHLAHRVTLGPTPDQKQDEAYGTPRVQPMQGSKRRKQKEALERIRDELRYCTPMPEDMGRDSLMLNSTSRRKRSTQCWKIVQALSTTIYVAQTVPRRCTWEIVIRFVRVFAVLHRS